MEHGHAHHSSHKWLYGATAATGVIAAPYLLPSLGFGRPGLTEAIARICSTTPGASLGLSGTFDSVSMVIRGTLSQLLTPDEMRGRVSSVNSMFIISSNEIGAFESGVAASLLGLVPSIVIGGVGTLIVVGMTALLSPKLRRTVVDTNAS